MVDAGSSTAVCLLSVLADPVGAADGGAAVAPGVASPGEFVSVTFTAVSTFEATSAEVVAAANGAKPSPGVR